MFETLGGVLDLPNVAFEAVFLLTGGIHSEVAETAEAECQKGGAGLW